MRAPASVRPADRTVSIARMQQIDATAIETLGIPRLLLMEHAGVAVARHATQLLPDRSRTIVVLCGSGFNGGDGLSAARHLLDAGYPLRIVLAADRQRLREEPAIYATMLERLGITLWPATHPELESWLAGAGLVIDALLGLGAVGQVREPMASLIARVNRSGRPVLAVDIPSGLDGDTGRPQGCAVRATATVTFGLVKQGCCRGDGPAYTGRLIVEPITFPRALLEAS